MEYRKYYYFLENEKGQWHWINKRPKNDSERHPLDFDNHIYHFDEWTNDPMKANRHHSVQATKDWLSHQWELRDLKNLTITEHEFVITPT